MRDNHFHTSSGERISKVKIDIKVRKAKAEKLCEQFDEHGYNFCVKCVEDGLPGSANELELRTLDCSHIISVDRCQKEGRAELAWDKDNIRILCRHHHRIHDKTY